MARALWLYHVLSMVADLRLIVGYFDGNAGSSPTTVVGLGLNTTTPVTRVDVGIFTLNLAEKAERLLGAFFQVGENTPDDYKICVDRNATDVTSATAPQVTFTHFDGAGAAANVAATGRIWFLLLLSDRSSDR